VPHIIGGKEISKDYNEIYLHEDMETRIAKLEMWTAKAIGETLVKNYPKRQWGVNVDIPGAMVVITCPSLSHTHGYHIAMKNDNIETLCKRAVNAGGEILERYGISRGRVFNPEHLETLERMPSGDAITRDAMDTVDPIKRHG